MPCLNEAETLASCIRKAQQSLADLAIEGEVLDIRQVRSSLARRLGIEVAGVVPSPRTVDGIVEMMLDATRSFGQPLTAERLFGWHAALFPTGRSGMRRIIVGGWRTAESGPMQVVSGPIGRERVHFEAPDAKRVAGEMDAFLEWFNAPMAIDPVMKAGVAHFRFVTIHPFEDGNGRIARAIADMALARADGRPERFYSMSAQIEAERRAYYEVLEDSQKGGMDITPWLKWFLECLGRALTRAEGTLASVLRKAHVWQWIGTAPVNERQRKVLNRLLDGFEGKLTTSKYAALTACSNDTALRDIQALVAQGVLAQNERGGRSASYRLMVPNG
jgi:Fic family protein